MDVIYYILFLLLFLIICSIFFKNIEGFDDEFYYDKLIDYKTIPNSYVNDSTPSRTINKFGFYKGEGTFKKGFSAETKSDEKISTLNKLLNRLLGRIVSDNQDCVGDFGKYSECDKSCGSNSYQTRTYNVSQERGQNGLDCAFEDGYKEKKRCGVDQCQLGDICENNADCGTGNCGVNSTRCENMVPCDTKNVHVCDEDDCIKLNDDDGDNDDVKMLDGVYIYNNVDEECFFKTPAEIEELNLNIYTYDYRTISEQVKNLVLDCKYYQVKKDGVGPCINGSNITVEGEEAKCKLGFGPQPTMFNGSNACTECLIINDDETYKNADECVCGPHTSLDISTYTCEPYTGPQGNVCPEDVGGDLYFVKFLSPVREGTDPECQPCPDRTAFRKEDDGNISCIPCAGEMQTLSSICLDSGSCPTPDLIKLNLTDLHGEPLTDGSPLTDVPSYQEQCVITTDNPSALVEEYDYPGRCPIGVSDCSNKPNGPYVCERGYKGNFCGTWCQDDQEGCVESGEVCLKNDEENRLECLLAEGGRYIDEDGLVVSATGLLTNCTEYGDFFPIVGADCIGACKHTAAHMTAGGIPGVVAAEWKYRPGKDTDGLHHGCPADAEQGTTSCSPAGSYVDYEECRFCGGRDNIKELHNGTDGDFNFLPEGITTVTKDGNNYKFDPETSDVDLRWNSPCINPGDMETATTFSAYLKSEQDTSSWRYDDTSHAWVVTPTR